MRKATQLLVLAVVLCGLTAWATTQSMAQTQKKSTAATGDTTQSASTTADDGTQAGGGTDTGGSSATTKKKKGTSSGSGGSDKPSESGVAPAPKGGGNSGGQENPKESVEYKDPEDQMSRKSTTTPSAQPAGNVNGVVMGDHVVKPDITLRKAGGNSQGQENPKESVTVVSPGDVNGDGRPDIALRKAGGSGGQEQPVESKAAQPASGRKFEDGTVNGDRLDVTGRPAHMNAVQNPGSSGSTGTGQQGQPDLMTRKAGMDQKSVAASGDNPKETVTSIDAHTTRVTLQGSDATVSGEEQPKETVTGTAGTGTAGSTGTGDSGDYMRKKMPGKMKSGTLTMTNGSTSGDNPKETVTSTAAGGENPKETVTGTASTGTASTGTGQGSSDATIRRRKSTSSSKDDAVAADPSTATGTSTTTDSSTDTTTKKPK
jgi:hypothetical protein